MQDVPWGNAYPNVDDFKRIFTFPEQPNDVAIGFNAEQWRRAYPYIPLRGRNSERGRQQQAQESSSNIRIVGPPLRFQPYFGGAASRKFAASAWITLNAPFLQFLETFDASLAEQLHAMPGFENCRFQGLVKKSHDIRVLELPIDEQTAFISCDDRGESISVADSACRAQFTKTWNIGIRFCRPTFRVENWFVNPIFRDVRLRIVCESLLFYPRNFVSARMRSLDSIERRYRIYHETGIDIDALEQEDDIEMISPLPLRQRRVNAVINVEPEEERRARLAKERNVGSGWCPALTTADEELALQWEDEEACCICLNNLCNAAFDPCKHVCACIPCVQQLSAQQCPVCRANVVRVTRVVAAVQPDAMEAAQISIAATSACSSSSDVKREKVAQEEEEETSRKEEEILF